MAWVDSHLLTTLTFFPLLWALLGLALPEGSDGKITKTWTFVGTLLTFGLSWMVYRRFDAGTADFQFTEKMPWIADLGVHYQLGIDGISLWLVMLTTFLMAIVAFMLLFFALLRVRMRWAALRDARAAMEAA